jgi:hypothetical protein
MYLIYIVRNDGIGAIGPATFDLTCEPSECYWLVPGTEQDDAPKPGDSAC